MSSREKWATYFSGILNARLFPLGAGRSFPVPLRVSEDVGGDPGTANARHVPTPPVSLVLAISLVVYSVRSSGMVSAIDDAMIQSIQPC